MVKNGVAQAQEELRKEADNQIWQEGILRLDSERCKRDVIFSILFHAFGSEMEKSGREFYF